MVHTTSRNNIVVSKNMKILLFTLLLVLTTTSCIHTNQKKDSPSETSETKITTEFPIKSDFFGGVKFGMSQDTVLKALYDNDNLEGLWFRMQKKTLEKEKDKITFNDIKYADIYWNIVTFEFIDDKLYNISFMLNHKGGDNSKPNYIKFKDLHSSLKEKYKSCEIADKHELNKDALYLSYLPFQQHLFLYLEEYNKSCEYFEFGNSKIRGGIVYNTGLTTLWYGDATVENKLRTKWENYYRDHHHIDSNAL